MAASIGRLIRWSWIDAPLSAKAVNRRLEAGPGTVEVGLGLRPAPPGRGLDLSLLRIGL